VHGTIVCTYWLGALPGAASVPETVSLRIGRSGFGFDEVNILNMTIMALFMHSIELSVVLQVTMYVHVKNDECFDR
jgi:hypothetical protein